MLRVTFKYHPHTRHFIPTVKTLLIGFWGVCFVFVCGFFGIYFWVLLIDIILYEFQVYNIMIRYL